MQTRKPITKQASCTLAQPAQVWLTQHGDEICPIPGITSVGVC